MQTSVVTVLVLIVIHCGVSREEAAAHFKAKCHSNYYNEPTCIDHPDGYGCECGSGFHWNTEMCMSTAIDSRLEFKAKRPVRYTLLLGKAFPKLTAFTVAFWVRLSDGNSSTILSYKHGGRLNLIRMGVTMFYVWGEIWGSKNKLILTEQLPLRRWVHVTWTWDSRDGSFAFYKNAVLKSRAIRKDSMQIVPSGGEIVLGQDSREKFEFNVKHAFVGDLAHLHIWNFVMSKKDIEYIYTSFNFMYCGNAAQWADFRSGTRGAMRMRWPSGIYPGMSYSHQEEAKTCNKHCSDKIGAQCNKDTVENIVWERTKANVYLNVTCPGQEHLDVHNASTDVATRYCKVTEINDGKWESPNIDNCISPELLLIKDQLAATDGDLTSGEEAVIGLSQALWNSTEVTTFTNPIDVATVIDVLEALVRNQQQITRAKRWVGHTWSENSHVFGQTEVVFPNMEQIRSITKTFLDTIDNLLSRKNELAWNVTKPPGVEGDNLLQVTELFSQTLAEVMEYHIRHNNIDPSDTYIFEAKPNVEFRAASYYMDRFHGSTFPSEQEKKTLRLPIDNNEVTLHELPDSFRTLNTTSTTFQILFFRFRHLGMHLPNHDRMLKSKEDNVNTPIMATYVFSGNQAVSHNLSSPITFTMPFLDTFNISNPECVRIRHGVNYLNMKEKIEWRWRTDDCHLTDDRHDFASCACYRPGVFAITTDMYNVNWDKGERRPILMNAASYLGCALSSLLCLATVVVHLYCRTSSMVASLHKSLAVSILFSQLVFMIGINRHEIMIMCHVFAVLIHFFFLTTYAWLMNEAFSLYTSVTYSTHGEVTDSGSLVRYHFLGWIVPAVLVGAFVGSQGNSYYAKDMCWVAWDNLWIFVGPTLGIMAVTIMVLIFTAKEHNENSYTKSEKTNKVIMVNMKGLWTQVILLTVNWSFAFLSLKMHDSIIKYLYAMMNVLQASFFFVFNLLHDEVRDVLKTKDKVKTLTIQGVDHDTDDHSVDSSVSSPLIEKDVKEALPLEKRRQHRDKGRQYPGKRSQHGSDESLLKKKALDCEKVTSV